MVSFVCPLGNELIKRVLLVGAYPIVGSSARY